MDHNVAQRKRGGRRVFVLLESKMSGFFILDLAVKKWLGFKE
jgi:hypothetical protein